jgi:hypothetical protein
MKNHRRKSLAVSFALAMGLATAFFGGTAHAADTAKPTPKLVSDYLTWMTGFNGTTPSTALYHLSIKRSNGNVFLGTQSWWDCTDNIEQCKSYGDKGPGWTKPVAVVLVRTSSNTFVLRSGTSQGQITIGKNGLTKAYVIGDGEANVTRSNNQLSPTQLTPQATYSLDSQYYPLLPSTVTSIG